MAVQSGTMIRPRVFFNCDECSPPSQWRTTSDRDRHRLAVHVSKTCDRCKVSFALGSQLRKHYCEKYQENEAVADVTTPDTCTATTSPIPAGAAAPPPSPVEEWLEPPDITVEEPTPDTRVVHCRIQDRLGPDPTAMTPRRETLDDRLVDIGLMPPPRSEAVWVTMEDGRRVLLSRDTLMAQS